MSDNLLGSRFLQRGDKPAWHLKGDLIHDAELSAEEALTRIYPVRVVKRPLETTFDGKVIPIPHAIIVREAIPEDPQVRIFGRPVSKDYELIGPLESGRVYDRAAGNVIGQNLPFPVETVGVLGKGEEIFITSQGYEFNVKGDAVQSYIFMYSPMYSDKAAIIGITSVRIVCQNTLTAAISGSVQKVHIDHLPGATDKLEKAMRQMFTNSRMVVDAMKGGFEALAAKPVKNKKHAEALLEKVYENPPLPNPDWDMQFGISFEQHMQLYNDVKLPAVRKIRSTVLGLYEGEGIGTQLESVNGNMFGLFNAVSEFETYRKGPGERIAVGLVAGDRAATIRKAYKQFSEAK